MRLRRRPAPPAATAHVRSDAARRLHLDVGRRLDGLLQGEHLGILPGPGTEPGEARLYAPGDDVRRIDWAVTARAVQTHVRDAVAERELETTVVADLTGSLSFGTAHWEKRELAVSVAAAFTHLGTGPGDRVGAVVLSGAGVRRVPPRSGDLGALALLHVLLSTPRTAGPGPSLAEGLRAVGRRRRGLVVVVSDLVDEAGGPSGWGLPLRRLSQRHDVVVVELVDPRELTLPDVGVLRLVDPETGAELEVATSRRVREDYARAAATRRAAGAALLRSAGAEHVVLRTDRDWLVDLARALVRRRRTRGVVR